MRCPPRIPESATREETDFPRGTVAEGPGQEPEGFPAADLLKGPVSDDGKKKAAFAVRLDYDLELAEGGT